MKLVIIGLIILLVFINLKLLIKFRKEGLAEVDQKPNVIVDGFNRVSKFFSFKKPEIKAEDKDRKKLLDRYLKFRPGQRIASRPLYDGKKKDLSKAKANNEKALFYERGNIYDNKKPFSYWKEQKIVDDNAGQSGTGGSSAADPTTCDEDDPITGERCKASKERAEADRLLKLGNIVEVTYDSPIYDAAVYTTHESNNLDDVIAACVNNNWETRKLSFQEKRSTVLKNKGGFGWNKKPMEVKPCIGFWSEMQNPEKYHILIPCDDDCDQLDVTPVGGDIEKMPAEGEVFFPGGPSDKVGKVWRIKSGIGAKASLARADLSESFKELKEGEVINNVEIAAKSQSGDTFLQAANRCAQKRGNIPDRKGNPCIGMVKKKGDDAYYFLYKALGQYEPDDEQGIESVLRRLKSENKSDYRTVYKGNPIRNVSAMLGEQIYGALPENDTPLKPYDELDTVITTPIKPQGIDEDNTTLKEIEQTDVVSSGSSGSSGQSGTRKTVSSFSDPVDKSAGVSGGSGDSQQPQFTGEGIQTPNSCCEIDPNTKELVCSFQCCKDNIRIKQKLNNKREFVDYVDPNDPFNVSITKFPSTKFKAYNSSYQDHPCRLTDHPTAGSYGVRWERFHKTCNTFGPCADGYELNTTGNSDVVAPTQMMGQEQEPEPEQLVAPSGYTGGLLNTVIDDTTVSTVEGFTGVIVEGATGKRAGTCTQHVGSWGNDSYALGRSSLIGGNADVADVRNIQKCKEKCDQHDDCDGFQMNPDCQLMNCKGKAQIINVDQVGGTNKINWDRDADKYKPRAFIKETQQTPITAGEDVPTFENCMELRELMWNSGPEGYPMSKSKCKKAKKINCRFIAHTECGCASWDNLKYSDAGNCDSVEILSQYDTLKSKKENVYFLINGGADNKYTLETKNAKKVEVYVGSGNGNSLKIKYTDTKPDVVHHIGSGDGLDTCELISQNGDKIRC